MRFEQALAGMRKGEVWRTDKLFHFRIVEASGPLARPDVEPFELEISVGGTHWEYRSIPSAFIMSETWSPSPDHPKESNET